MMRTTFGGALSGAWARTTGDAQRGRLADRLRQRPPAQTRTSVIARTIMVLPSASRTRSIDRAYCGGYRQPDAHATIATAAPRHPPALRTHALHLALDRAGGDAGRAPPLRCHRGFAAYAVLMLPEVDPWHTIRLKGEFTERRRERPGLRRLPGDRSAACSKRSARPSPPCPPMRRTTSAAATTRTARRLRLAPGQPYNRSSRRTPPQVRGAALLDSRLVRFAVLDAERRPTSCSPGFEVTDPAPARTWDAAERHGRHGLRRLGGGNARRRARHQHTPAARPALLHRRLLHWRFARAHRMRWIASLLAAIPRSARPRVSCCSRPPWNWFVPRH